MTAQKLLNFTLKYFGDTDMRLRAYLYLEVGGNKRSHGNSGKYKKVVFK